MQADRMAAGGAQDTSNRPGRGALLALGSGVFLAHLLALQQLPAVLAPPDLAKTRTFITRSIVVQPAPAPAAQAPAPAPPPPPPARRRPRPAPPPALPVADAPPVAADDVPAAVTAPEPAAEPPLAEPVLEPGPATEPAPAPAAEPVPPEPTEPTAAPPQQAASAPATEAPAAGPTALALAIPGSVRLNYTLTGESKQMEYHAFGELLWLQDGQTYDARLEYSALLVGSRVRTSSGKLTERGLEPTRFSDRWRRRHLSAQFERDKAEVSFSTNTPRAPLLPDAQDQLSVLLQLASMVAGDPSLRGAGTRITVPVVGPRDADVWTFTLHGEELVHLPYDNLQALRLTRDPRRTSDQKVEAWLAPSLAYMPVRVRITLANGDFVDQKLRNVAPP